MSIIIKSAGRNLVSDESLTTYEAIERAINMEVSGFTVIQIDSEEHFQDLKNRPIYAFDLFQGGNDENVSMLYAKGIDSFPLVGFDFSGKIPGVFEINCGAIVYYPNRTLPEHEEVSNILGENYKIYTTEPFEKIVKEYSEKRKCLIVREFPSENRPMILTSKTEPFESVEFMEQVVGGKTIK